MIEIQILHDKTIHSDNESAIRILLDGEDTSILELDCDKMLHITGIMMHITNKLIKYSDNLLKNERDSKKDREHTELS